MLTSVLEINNVKMVFVETENGEPIIYDTASALDFAMSLNYNYETSHIILQKDVISNDFFDLSSGLAGEILQKYVNYKIHLAIIGDFSEGSNALKDFIREANKGKKFYFVSSLDEAVDYLSK